MSSEEIEKLDDDSVEQAIVGGAALSELMGLFAYFLNNTAEGQQAKKDLEKDWEQACNALREEKLIKGPQFSCSQWFKHLQKELLTENKKAPKKKAKPMEKKPEKKKALKFKNTRNKR